MKSTTTLLLPTLLFSFFGFLQQHTVFAQEDKDQDCFDVCGDYIRWGYDCARREGCFRKQQTDEDAFVSCYQDCNIGASVCQEMCLQNYNQLKAACDKKCEDASLMDVFCNDECLEDDFKAQFASQLPVLTSHDTGIFQGIPLLGDEDEDEDEEDEDDEDIMED